LNLAGGSGEQAKKYSDLLAEFGIKNQILCLSGMGQVIAALIYVL
jgi:DNA repair ATPase RecN